MLEQLHRAIRSRWPSPPKNAAQTDRMRVRLERVLPGCDARVLIALTYLSRSPSRGSSCGTDRPTAACKSARASRRGNQLRARLAA